MIDQHNLLYPPIPLDDVKANNQVLYMHSASLNDVFPTIFDVNSQVQEKLDAVFTEEIPALLDSDRCLNLKAAFLMLGDIRCIDRPKSDELRQMVSEEFRKHRIPLFIGNYEVFIATSLLAAADIESKPKETVLGLFVSEYRVSVYELYRESDGYILINRRFVRIDEMEFALNMDGPLAKLASELTLEKFKEVMPGKSNPKCVIIAHSNGSKKSLLPHLTQLFSSNKVIEVELNDDKLVAALTKNMFDPSFNKFYVIPVSDDCLAVTKKNHDIGENDSIISAQQYYTNLPFVKSEVVPKSMTPFYIVRWPTCSHKEPKKCASVTKYEPLNGNGHRTKLTLIIDKNGFSYLYQQAYIIPQVEALPQTLTSQHILDVPVIGFFDNSSVICVRGENGYDFLESWNGMYGKDLFISFEHEMPQLITGNDEVNRKNTFMVFDLVKILSMPFDKIVINPEWTFNITKKDRVLAEFRNFEGKQKSMAPVSLMSLLLEHHIEAIKDETGKKPTELGFYIFDKIDKNGKKLLEKGLSEACKLMEIECSFVKKN